MEENIKIIKLPQPKSKINIKKEKREKNITKNQLWMENIKEDELKVECQYNVLTDYQAAIKSFENFLIEFPGSDLREKALYYRFDSAYKLAVNSVVWRQQERIENVVSYFNSFKNNFKESDFLEEMESKMSELTEINNI